MLDELLKGDPAAPVWFARGRDSSWTYGHLRERLEGAQSWGAQQGRRLAFVVGRPGFRLLEHYLQALAADWPALLLTPGPFVTELERLYRPSAWLGEEPPPCFRSLRPGVALRDADHRLHPDLKLLLTTSGTTGSPKLVRLSARNLLSNARAIAEVLELDPTERGLACLPFSHAYGLSVVNSHLWAGAALVEAGSSLLEDPFWEGAARATSIPGVPAFWEGVLRLRIPLPPSVRTLTQAGGPLAVAHQRALLQTGRRVFVMYGQTEATARMTCLPWRRLEEKLGTVGPPLPGGRLWVGAGGQLHYAGPNVMLGYAHGPADLARGDECGGELATGDLGTCDAEGYVTVTGRCGRFAKLGGQRLDLDWLQSWLEEAAGAPVRLWAGEGRLEGEVEAPVEPGWALQLGLPARWLHLTQVPAGMLSRGPKRAE